MKAGVWPLIQLQRDIRMYCCKYIRIPKLIIL